MIVRVHCHMTYDYPSASTANELKQLPLLYFTGIPVAAR